MRFLLIFACVFLGVACVPFDFFSSNNKAEPANVGWDEWNYERAPAVKCNVTDCTLPNCRCSSADIPGGLNVNNTPQFVMLTYDDAVQITNIDYYREILNGRTNPNNCSISATFFINHEYTNYGMVHELHAAGHEIALHSITHHPITDYWRYASVENLTKEFVDQRLMMTRFASIPAADIKGIRMPFLQMAGDNQFEVLNNNSFLYDLSRGHMDSALWPYSYKYQSTQDCPIDPCPTGSYPNVWSIPMLYWDNDVKNQSCSMVDACVIYDEAPGKILEWMKREFTKHYTKNRSPMGIFLHAAWFQAKPQRLVEYKQFLDYLKTLPDVYISSATQVINWIKAPKTVAEMKTQACHRTYTPNCSAKACRLLNVEGNERWMTSCAPACPESYPWYGNPFGS